MASRQYVPDAGDVVWLEFDPQAGHEHPASARVHWVRLAPLGQALQALGYPDLTVLPAQ